MILQTLLQMSGEPPSLFDNNPNHQWWYEQKKSISKVPLERSNSTPFLLSLLQHYRIGPHGLAWYTPYPPEVEETQNTILKLNTKLMKWYIDSSKTQRKWRSSTNSGYISGNWDCFVILHVALVAISFQICRIGFFCIFLNILSMTF